MGTLSLSREGRSMTRTAPAGQASRTRPDRRWRLRVGAGLGLLAAIYALGLHQQLPYVYHADEPTNFNVVRSMFSNRTANPHFFNYPSLLFYVQALAQLPFALLHHGSAITSQVGGSGLAPNAAMVVVGRAFTAAFALMAVAVSGWAALRVTRSHVAALVAGALVGLSPLVSANARYITPDVYAAFFATAACAVALRISEGASLPMYALGGTMVGLAAGSKYNAALAAVPILVAHILRRDSRDRSVAPLAVAGAAAMCAFIASTPYALLDTHNFLTGVRAEQHHYATSHPGFEGHSPKFYAMSLWKWHGPLLLLAAVPVAVQKYRRFALVLASFVVAYLAFISSFVVHFERNELPALPALLLMAGIGAWAAWERLRSRRARLTAAVAFSALMLIPLAHTARTTYLARHDERAAAREWLDALPAGTRLAMEPYTPWVDGTRLTVVPVVVGQEDEAWYLANVDYIVLGKNSYGRFYRQPDRYRSQLAAYDALRHRFPLARQFNQYGYEVLVLRVRQD